MPKIEKAYIQIYIILVVALFLWSSFYAIRYPYGIDYGEAPLADQARRIVNHEPLFKAEINHPPYVISNYPPLFPSLLAVTKSVLNIPFFQSGRVLSVIFSLLSGYIIGLFTCQLTQNRWIAVFSSVLFIGQPYVTYWSSLSRVDLMALAFSLLGLWMLFRYRDSGIGILAATTCFLVSVFTRQTYLLAGPLAGFLWLWHLNRKRSLFFLAFFFFTGLLIFGTINALSHGGFYLNIIMSNINQFIVISILSAGKSFFVLWPFTIIIVVIIIGLTIYTQFSKHTNNQLQTIRQPFIFHGLVFYTIGATMSALTIGKIGSNVNYFLELMAACAIWIGIAWKMVLDQKKTLQWTFFGIIVLQSIWALTNNYVLIQQNIHRLNDRQLVISTIGQKITQAAQIGPVLSDDYMDLIVLAGQPIYYQPFEYGELYNARRWDPAAFIAQIDRRMFPMIIVGGDTLYKDCCWPQPVINALEANYKIVYGENMVVLTPNR